MRGVYKLTVDVAAVTTKKTLLWLTAPAAAVVEILSARITFRDEDSSEQIEAELNRIATVGSAAGTSITPKKLEESDGASGSTCYSNLTVEPTTYDAVADSIAHGGANKLAGWEYLPLPEERPIIKPSDNVGLRLLADIANSTGLTAEITFREIG